MAAHYHVTINGEDRGWAYASLDLDEAEDTAEESRRKALDDESVAVKTCEDAQCGPYLDLVAFTAYSRQISTDDVMLEREHARMVIELDGHGPVE